MPPFQKDLPMILVVFGTRPEALKLAGPVKLARERGLPIHVHCTGQSPDLLDQAVLPWDSRGNFHALHFPEKQWDFIVVQGDTRTVHESAWLAFELGVPIFHLESGVRTYDLTAPYPEEAYRQSVARIARWHACTTEHNRQNLWNEGIVNRVRVTGSPIVESVRERVDWEQVAEGTYPFALVTLHRRENRGHFADILRGVEDALLRKMAIVWYGHPNSWAAEEANTAGLTLTPFPPEDPKQFATNLAMAEVVITDSGGCQEECATLSQVCIVARTVTDRPESLGAGGAFLGGNTRESVSHAIRNALSIDRSDIDPTIFGDGKASERICDWWTEILGAR